GQTVIVTLTKRWSPLLATLLADLPILPADGLAASLGRLVSGAKSVDRKALGTTVDRTGAAVNAVECDAEAPPAECAPAEHVTEIDDWLTRAGRPATPHTTFSDVTGAVE